MEVGIKGWGVQKVAEVASPLRVPVHVPSVFCRQRRCTAAGARLPITLDRARVAVPICAEVMCAE